MENGKVGGGGGDKPTSTDVTTATTEQGEEQNPNSTTTEEVAAVPIRQSSRTPFTNLSQVDADLALARTLQEQERAYMMLAMNNEGSDYGSWETGSYSNEEDFDDPNDDTDAGDVDGDENEDGGTDVDDDDDDDDDDDEQDEDDDEDAFDVHAHDDFDEDDIPSVEIDPSAYPDDEAYARALQDAEEREMASRLLALAGLNDRIIGVSEDVEDHDGDLQDTWEEVDPDELSYEELLALGDVVGTESRGLSSAKIASLQSINYKAQNNQDGINDSCVICRLDFEEDDTLTVLSCKHSYHSECINNWLHINKVCPVCSAEVSTSENR